MRTRAILAILILCAGCNSATAPGDGDAGVCGPCPAGQGCDVSKAACVPALPEGARCGADALDGGPTVCQDGLDCGIVPGGTLVCARTCTDASQCGAGRTCVIAQYQDQSRQYCAAQASLGQACNPVSLEECSPGSAGQIVDCIASGTDAGNRCMARCDSTIPCPAGQACSAPIGDGSGVCATPTSPGDHCDQSQFIFCSAGQVCITVSGTAGFCHTTCDATGTTCAGGGACIAANPCASDAGQPFCVSPQPIDGGCDPALDQFCGPGGDCINLGTLDAGAFVCKPDCSSGQACAAGSCRPTFVCNSGPSSMACF